MKRNLFVIKKQKNSGLWNVCLKKTHKDENPEVLASCGSLEDAKFFYLELTTLAGDVGITAMRQWIQECLEGEHGYL